MSLGSLYHKVILEHSNHPVNFEKREQVDWVIEAYNPLCGDKYTLFLEVENDRVKEAHFHGYGCAISKASTSVLVEKIKGKTFSEILKICDQFYRYVDVDKELPTIDEIDETFEAFSGARQFPERMKCATLSWDELKEYLNLNSISNRRM